MRTCAWLSGLLLGIVFSTGCGSNSSSSTGAQLRVLQASPDAPQVHVLIDGKPVGGNLAYGNATIYLSVNTGSHHVQVVPVAGGSPIFDQSLSFSSSAKQTLLLSGSAAGIQPVILTDGGTTTTAGDGYVRVVNASASMGAADVYLVPAGSSIAGMQPTAASLAFDKDTGYKLLVAGNYEVFMTAPGTTNAFLSTGSITLNSSQNQTVVALDGTSGGFMFALLTD